MRAERTPEMAVVVMRRGPGRRPLVRVLETLDRALDCAMSLASLHGLSSADVEETADERMFLLDAAHYYRSAPRPQPEQPEPYNRDADAWLVGLGYGRTRTSLGTMELDQYESESGDDVLVVDVLGTVVHRATLPGAAS